ncbi:MAG: hypothetical protein ABI883_01060 [Chthoniobacterales bacterium]
MSEPEIDPASVPLLFPDPVIEYYLAKVDRAAIREQLKKTPGERLRALEKKAEASRPVLRILEEEAPISDRPKLDMGTDPTWFAEAEAVPLLFPDAVVEAYLKDVDRGLLREQLKLAPGERLRSLERMAEFYEAGRAGRSPAQ